MTITNTHPHEHHDVVVIGAGPAGLATAAALSRLGVEALVVDRGEQVGTSWRGHMTASTCTRRVGSRICPVCRSRRKRDGGCRATGSFAISSSTASITD